jgi:hypothetical protein
MADIEKLIGLGIQTWGNLKEGMQRVRIRLGRIEQIRARGGEIGSLFWWVYIFPQLLYRITLTCAAIAALLAIVGGMLLAFHSSALFPLRQFFENYWFIILAIGFLLWLVAGFDGISRVFIELSSVVPAQIRPEVLDSPDWFNVRQFSDVFREPQPLVLRQQGVDAVADLAIGRLISGQYKTDSFAAKPGTLSDAERGNAAFWMFA